MLVLPGFANAKTLVNVDTSGVAVKGYDPGVFFSEGKPVEGSANLHSVHEGATYYFANEGNKNGFDAATKSMNLSSVVTAQRRCRWEYSKMSKFIIHEGRLPVQRNDKAKTMFHKNPAKTLARADENWPKLVEEHGK